MPIIPNFTLSNVRTYTDNTHAHARIIRTHITRFYTVLYCVWWYPSQFASFVFIWGAFFWDYSVSSYSGIRITEYAEYQFPKEPTLCYSENRIADMTKIKAMRPRKSRYAIFPPKDRRKLPKEHDYRLFRQFCYREQN